MSLTQEQVATELGCDITTVRNLRSQGKLHPVKVTPWGKRIIEPEFDSEQVKAFKPVFQMRRELHAKGYYESDRATIYTLTKAAEVFGLSLYLLRKAVKKTDLLPGGKLPSEVIDPPAGKKAWIIVTGNDVLLFKSALQDRLRAARKVDRSRWRMAAELGGQCGGDSKPAWARVLECIALWVKLGWLETKEVYM